MANISILGTGTMGQAIGGLVAKGGNTVQQLNTSSAGEAVTGDIVILAVPYASAVEVVRQYGDALAGKVVIDISNTFTAPHDTELVTPDGSIVDPTKAQFPDQEGEYEEHQDGDPEPRGLCMNCGGYVYTDSYTCSDACAAANHAYYSRPITSEDHGRG